jgi:hypothetical protein
VILGCALCKTLLEVQNVHYVGLPQRGLPPILASSHQANLDTILHLQGALRGGTSVVHSITVYLQMPMSTTILGM